MVPAAADHGDIIVFADAEAEVDGPRNLIEGPGGMVWFTSTDSDRIGRIDPEAADPAASITTYSDAGIDAPWDLVLGPDGNMWFTADGAIGRIVPDTGVITAFPDATIDDGRGITVGPDDNLWFTSQANDRIGRITTAGVITTFTDAGIDSPSGIAPLPTYESPGAPPDAVWFANTGGDDLGRIDLPDETIHFLDVTDLDDPVQIESADTDSVQGLVFNSTGNDRMGGCHPLFGCAVNAAPLVDDLGAFVEDDTAGVSRLWLVDLENDQFHVIANAEAHDLTSVDVVDPSALLPLGGDQLWFTLPSTDRIGLLEVDGTDPTVMITSPVDEMTYTRGSLPVLEYTCADELGGAGVDECSSELGASGSALPDDGIGPYQIRAGARDGFGNLGTDRVDITVVGTTSCDGLPATIELAHGDDPSRIDDDVIVGTPGDDVIDVGWGEDVICGNGGNDVITTGPFPDRIFGGEGDDQIVAGDQADHVAAGPGDDVVRSGAGDDEVLGEAGEDVLRTGDGDDTVHGGTEKDLLHLGAGIDEGFGGAGDDTVLGQGGRDALDGGAGRDRLFGGDGNDRVKGATGDDVLDGGLADDQVNGADGRDALWGRDGRDVLDGGNDDDTLNGGPKRDVCFGRAGGHDRQVGCEAVSGVP